MERTNGTNNQRWNRIAVGDGIYGIVNVNRASTSRATAGQGNGGAVDRWQDDGAGAANEFWLRMKDGDGSYTIVNA